MAAPTNVRVEAIDLTVTIIRWSYSGSAEIAVYRSTDGSSYSEITTPGNRVNVGTTEYTDSGLDAGTKYWYKLTEDLGSNFSSVVTVWTQGCPTPSSADQQLGLPDGSLEDLARRVEELFQNLIIDPSKCIVCDDDGRLVFDCSSGCSAFQAILTDDVNSITFNDCPEDVPVDIVVPPNSTRKLCGHPSGRGFDGDECHNAPLIAGPNGATVSIGGGAAGGTRGQTRPSTGKTKNSGGGGGGGGGCACTPRPGNQLTIKSCNPNNSLKCTTTKSLNLLVCGGVGPYSWSKTGSVQLKGSQPGATAGSTATGSSVTVTPPANTGSGVAGDAYRIGKYHICGSGSNAMDTQTFSCNDSAGSCGRALANGAFHNADGPCGGGDCCSFCGDGGSAACSGTQNDAVVSVDHQAEYPGDPSGCLSARGCDVSGGTMCDARSAAMISAGCNPCGLQHGSTVSVTDATGKVVTIVLSAI